MSRGASEAGKQPSNAKGVGEFRKKEEEMELGKANESQRENQLVEEKELEREKKLEKEN